MNLESLLSLVSDCSFEEFGHISDVLEGSGFSLEAIQTGKDSKAPHGEVFRVSHHGAVGKVLGVLKISGANSANKLSEDLALSYQHKVSVPETHIFPVGQTGSLIVQPLIHGKAFESMSDDEYHFVLETLPQLRREILRLMDVFHKNFPTDERVMSRYPDLSGNRAAGYAMRQWMNLLVVPGEGGGISEKKLIPTLERISPKTCLVDTGWAIHETTQQRFVRDGVITHEYFGDYSKQISHDRGILTQIAQGKTYLGSTFTPSKEALGYLTPTHIATLAIPRQLAENMVTDKYGHVHIFRPNNREKPPVDDRGLHYVGVIEKHGCHVEKIPPQYSHQVPAEIVERSFVPLNEVSDLFANVHPDSGLTLGGFMEKQYGCVPTHTTHTILRLLVEKVNSIVTE